MSFRALPDHELDRRDDGALLAYLRRARAAGDRDAAHRALQLIVFGHWDVVAARVALRVPAHAVDDVAADVIVRAIASAFAGESVGELRAWLGTILGRTVADYYRARERTPPGGDPGALFEPPGTEPPDGYVAARMLVEQALGELRPDHRRVVELVVFADRPAAEACAEVPGMSGANAYQIVTRFRSRLRALLEESEHG